MNKNNSQIQRTKRTTLNRLSKRGHYDKKTLYSILDSALICHIAYVYEGEPRVIPTAFARIENDFLYMEVAWREILKRSHQE